MILRALTATTISICLATLLCAFHFMDFHRQFAKRQPGACTSIKGINFGSEDIEVVSDGLAFITSGIAFPFSPFQAYKDFMEKHNIKGAVYSLDLNNPESSLQKLRIQASSSFNPDTFRPHGLSVLENQLNGQHLLYIVSHVPGHSDRVEKFRYLPETLELVHLKSFSSSLFSSTNDIAITGEDSFYISNFMYYSKGILAHLENFLNLPFGNLLYFDGSTYRVVSSNLFGPNGLVLSRDGQHLYLATSKNKGIAMYERYSNNSLHLVQNFITGSVTDNLHISQDGQRLFAGVHPIAWKIINHIADPAQRSPSRVMRFALKESRIVEDVTPELFYDHGDLISASSIGFVYKDKLFVGSLLDKMVMCNISHLDSKT